MSKRPDARRGGWVPHLLSLLLCAVAFLGTQPYTHGLEWPAMDDSYREMAGAQTLLDEGFGGDFGLSR